MRVHDVRMKAAWAASLALFALPLSAQQDFRVVSIAPATGPIAGGTAVTIQVNEIPSCSILPPLPSITFGGAPASNASIGQNNTFLAVAPAHGAGVVDVEVRYCGAGVRVAEGFTYFDPAQDPKAEDFEKVLLPVVLYGPGARGSVWATRIFAHNSGPQPVDAVHPLFEGNPMCPAVCGCSALATIEPGQTKPVCIAGFSDPMGLIYYPRRSRADNVRFSSRIFDISRSSLNGGTEIPVVRERDFRTDGIVLVDIPMGSTFRTALRVYDPDQHDGGLVRMRIFAVDGETPVAEATVTLSYPIRTIAPDLFPIRPAFAYAGDLLTAFPALGSVSNVRIELRPITAGMRIWGFVSITNNDTQQVTVVSPQ